MLKTYFQCCKNGLFTVSSTILASYLLAAHHSLQKDDNMRLDKEEQAILASVKAEEWLPLDDQEVREKEYREIARTTFRKDSRISPTRSSGS